MCCLDNDSNYNDVLKPIYCAINANFNLKNSNCSRNFVPALLCCTDSTDGLAALTEAGPAVKTSGFAQALGAFNKAGKQRGTLAAALQRSAAATGVS